MALGRTLSHRSFRRLWFGQLASRIGDSVHEIALVWIVYEVTGDPTLLSLTFVASFLPTVALSLPAGAVVDRVNRKWVLVGSDLLRAAVVLVIPFVGRGPYLVPTVLTVAFVTGVADAIDGPARSAFVPRLVPDDDLDAANSLIRTTFSLSQVLFAAGGVVVAAFGSFTAFYVDAGTFLVSAAFVATIPSEHGVPDRDERADADSEDSQDDSRGVVRAGVARLLGDVRSVLGYVAGRRLLVNLLVLTAVLQFAVAPINVAAPVFAANLGLPGSLALGLLYSAFFSGMTAGTLVIGRFDDVVDDRRGTVVVSGLLAFGVSLTGAALIAADSRAATAASLGLFALAGLSFAAATVPTQTLGQLLVPDDRLGRYMAVSSTLSSGAFVVGLGLSGPLIGLTSARATLVGAGVLVAVVGVLFAFQPLARVHRQDDPGTASSPDREPAD